MGERTLRIIADAVYRFRLLHELKGDEKEDMKIARKYLEDCRHADNNYSFEVFIRNYFSRGDKYDIRQIA